MSLQINISSDSTIFNTLETEWLNLLHNTKVNHFFYSPYFLKSWWQMVGVGKLQLMTFRSDEQLVGIAPFFLDGDRKLKLIGSTDLADYLDIIVDHNYSKQVYRSLIQTLSTSQVRWRSVELNSLPENSASLTQLPALTKKLGWITYRKQQDVCPVIRLTSNWEEYLSSLKRKQRHEVRRKLKKLNTEQQHKFILIESESGLEKATADFIKLHQLSSPEKKSFWTTTHRDFFKDFIKVIATQGLLKLYFLEIEGERVATTLIIDYDQTFYLYNSGYDPNRYSQLSTGSILTAHAIHQAIDLGRKKFDFLRGDEEYKYRFGAVGESVYDLTLSKTE